MIPPTKWGMKPSLCGSPCREKTGWPVGEMIVVVVQVLVVCVALLLLFLRFSELVLRLCCFLFLGFAYFCHGVVVFPQL